MKTCEEIQIKVNECIKSGVDSRECKEVFDKFKLECDKEQNKQDCNAVLDETSSE